MTFLEIDLTASDITKTIGRKSEDRLAGRIERLREPRV